MNLDKMIVKAKSIPEIFDMVKSIVKEYLGADQAGLMVGISDLGSYQNGFIGAFYSLNANMIIINKRPLQTLKYKNPELYNYYLFHIMLHEYVHAIGSYDEVVTRQIVYEISMHYFGQGHIETKMAVSLEKFIPHLTYPGQSYQPPTDINIEFIDRIDRRNMDYIG